MQIVSNPVLMETICMKCQILFSEQENNITSLLSAEFALKVVKVKSRK